MFSLTQTSTRQREILEVVFRNGWDYMRGLLTGNKNNDEPQLPPPAVLRNILINLGPVYVKLGQLLSTRPDLLPGAYVEVLTDLQANVPPVAWSEIETLLQQELAQPISETFTTINPQAIAAGSIGQVHRATLKNGQDVALKVQRPGIDQIVAQDIAIIRGLAELVSLTEFGKTYDIVAIADEFVTALEAELDFTQEANYTDKLRSNLSNSRWFDSQQLVIPKIYWDLTSQKLLTIEWLEGAPLLSAQLSQTREGKDTQTQRREITTLLFRAFFQQVYIDGFFHADPHPGNIFYLRDGRVALLDCGMIGRLDPRSQQILTEMLLAIVDLDGKRCAQLTLQLSEASESVSLSGLENDYDRMLRKYYNRSLSKINFSEVFYEILQVSRNNKIRLPGNMGLYAKTLANLEGVTRGFYPEINLLDQIKPLITEVFRRQLLGDDPLQTLLRTVLDLKSLSLRSPSQIELFLNRVSSETLKWNITVPELDKLRYSIDDSANRLSFSIVVGSLIVGAAIVASGSQTPQMSVVTNILFAAASFLGLWLIVSILRSGRLR
ncbi:MULTISPECIES: AarF/ABC1/UbiB kinase family protein [unclassified Moorena]|uniref:ABC1 kinase family protein n=1 Tax=unclassified Moorena TaxID=2683338 RepID=UPI0013C9A58B|nr:MULTISPECIES: AarF/ABC1/UbiB kinase family protein [unclassified Moorena]NEO23036.1 AarF/ABC1/UbiB kinase family protein [Moorena sp. SIO4A5]NEQ61047.1 AarF/ABC1/UbiB kinase family protein [Moorena sp. SIO4A1]